jgi:ribosomal protein S18 acetylase RimI-like enzyme
MKYEERGITLKEYQGLRESAGWWETDKTATKAALDNSFYSIAAMAQGKIVGMGRVIGDGLYYYVQDLVVHPTYQSKGIGREIMGMLMHYINTTAPKGSFVGLMAAKDLEGFYEKFGFKKRPNGAPGMYFVK